MTHPRNPPASAPPADTDPDERARRAREEAMTARPLRDGGYVVETDGGTYVVDLDGGSCTCPDHAIRGARCKHLRRVAIDINEGRLPAPRRRTAVCAACGEPTPVPAGSAGPRLCDRHDREPGDLVRDRERGTLLVVTERTATRADEYRVGEARRPVAAFETNADYGAHEPVVVAVYLPDRPGAGGELASRKRYAFPATRLVPLDGGDRGPDPGRDRPGEAAA